MDKSIIELKSVIRYGDFDNRVNVNTVGYFSDYDVIKREIETLCNHNDYFYIMFLTIEHSVDFVDNNDDHYHRVIRYRQYKKINGEIVMTHETERAFKGHVPDKYSYKAGDIIEYIGHYYEDEIYVGIICKTPISIERVNELKTTFDLFDENNEINEIDDSYLVYYLGGGDTHDHALSVNIIGKADVSDEIRKQYEDILKERLEKYTKKWEI